MAKPLHDRIAETKARRDKASARLAVLESKAKQADRKRDTRRKIVVGAAVLSEIERNPRLRAFLHDMLGKAVTRPQDRDSIADLLVAPPPLVPHQPAANAAGFPVTVREKQAS